MEAEKDVQYKTSRLWRTVPSEVRRGGRIGYDQGSGRACKKVDEHRSYAINVVACESMQENEVVRGKKTIDGCDVMEDEGDEEDCRRR